MIQIHHLFKPSVFVVHVLGLRGEEHFLVWSVHICPMHAIKLELR